MLHELEEIMKKWNRGQGKGVLRNGYELLQQAASAVWKRAM